MSPGEILFYGLTFAVCGFSLWHFFQPGELLDFWPALADKAVGKAPVRIQPYLKKPLFDCLTCLSGQLALWVSLAMGLSLFAVPIVGYTIFFSWLIGKIHTAFDIWI